jgi:hypothetical protein
MHSVLDVAPVIVYAKLIIDGESDDENNALKTEIPVTFDGYKYRHIHG